jgi:hypothetical protein
MKKILSVFIALIILSVPFGAFAAIADVDYTWHTFFEVENVNEETGEFDLVCYYQSNAPYTRSLSIGFSVPLSVADAYYKDYEMTRGEIEEYGLSVNAFAYVTYNRESFPESVSTSVTLPNGKVVVSTKEAFSTPEAIQQVRLDRTDSTKLFVTATYVTPATAGYYESGYPLGTEPVEAFRVSMKGDSAETLAQLEIASIGTESYGGDEGVIGFLTLDNDMQVVTTDPNVYIAEDGSLIFAGYSTKKVEEGKIVLKIPGYSSIELPAGVFTENPNLFGVSLTGLPDSNVTYKAVADGVSGKSVTAE